MKLMTESKQRALLDAIARELSSTSMINMDDILYGLRDSCKKSGNEYHAVERIMLAVPKEIREDYNRELRKKEADKLREKADKLERGE